MIWLLVIALAQLACHQQPVLPVWTNLDTGDAFSPPYEVFHSGQRREVNNCASAMAAVREGFEPRNPVDYAPLRLAALQCQAQQLVASARPSITTHWNAADSVPSSLLSGDGWQSKASAAAHGDFNGDSLEDRLFSVEEWPAQGTARRVRFLLLEKKSPSATPALLRELTW